MPPEARVRAYTWILSAYPEGHRKAVNLLSIQRSFYLTVRPSISVGPRDRRFNPTLFSSVGELADPSCRRLRQHTNFPRDVSWHSGVFRTPADDPELHLQRLLLVSMLCCPESLSPFGTPSPETSRHNLRDTALWHLDSLTHKSINVIRLPSSAYSVVYTLQKGNACQKELVKDGANRPTFWDIMKMKWRLYLGSAFVLDQLIRTRATRPDGIHSAHSKPQPMTNT